MTSELYLPIFNLLLSKARELENDLEFVKLLEQLYWAIISGCTIPKFLPRTRKFLLLF
jgi:hypothetical protein